MDSKVPVRLRVDVFAEIGLPSQVLLELIRAAQVHRCIALALLTMEYGRVLFEAPSWNQSNVSYVWGAPTPATPATPVLSPDRDVLRKTWCPNSTTSRLSKVRSHWIRRRGSADERQIQGFLMFFESCSRASHEMCHVLVFTSRVQVFAGGGLCQWNEPVWCRSNWEDVKRQVMNPCEPWRWNEEWSKCKAHGRVTRRVGGFGVGPDRIMSWSFWRRQWLSSDVGTGGSNAACWQSLFSLSVIFLVAPRFRQHHQALIQAMVNMVDVWLMYGTSQADPFRELLESFCVLNVSKYLMEPLSSWSLSQTQRQQRQPVLSISAFVSKLCTGRWQVRTRLLWQLGRGAGFFCFLCTCSRVFECWVLVDPFISASLMNWEESPKSQPSPGLERETDCKSLEWQESISTVDPFVEYLGSLGLSLHRFLLVLPATKFSLLRLCAGTSRSRRERHAPTLQSL